MSVPTCYQEIYPSMREQILRRVKKEFGPFAEIVEGDRIQIMYPGDPSRPTLSGKPYHPVHGYLAINGGQCWICDSTPDKGDEVLAIYPV